MFVLDRRSPNLGEQLAGKLRDAIGDGRLGAGVRLPATRDLAGELGVSRGVVVGAYEQLLAEGRLTARPGSGTYVAEGGAIPAPRSPRRSPTVQPLRPGIPDLSLFPRRAWRRAYESALAA